MNHEEIRKAKQTLHDAGYYVESLWHVRDVVDHYECDNDTAHRILSEVLEAGVDGIFESIHHQAKYYNNLKEKQQ